MAKGWAAVLGIWALVAGHFALLLWHAPPVLQSPDANGYYAQVRLLAEHGRAELVPESPLSYIGFHWLSRLERDPVSGREIERFHSRYSPGVARLLTPFYVAFGPKLALLVTPLLASLSLAFLFLLCRPYTGAGLALAGAAVYALHPSANSHALNWGSHTQVAFLALAGLLCLDRWAGNPAAWKAFLGGLCLGAMPAMRPAEAVAGIGVAVFLADQLLGPGPVRERHRWHVVAAVCGAALPIGALLAHNGATFGHPLRTAYMLTGEQQLGTGFHLDFFLAKWEPFARGLMSTGAGVFFPLGFAGCLAMLWRRETRGVALLVAGVIVPITLIYMAYYWGGGERVAGLRFLIPTFALYVLPALWLIRKLPPEQGVARTAAAALLGLQALLWAPAMVEQLGRDQARLERVHTAVGFLEERVPAGSLLLVDFPLGESLQFYPWWTLLDGQVASANPPPAGDEEEPEDVARPVQANKARVLRRELAELHGVAHRRRVAAEIDRLRGTESAEVYRMVPKLGSRHAPGYARSARARAAVKRLSFPSGERFVLVGSVTLPDEPSASQDADERHSSERRLRVGRLGGPAPGVVYDLYRLGSPTG